MFTSMGLFATIGQAAKGLFSGANKQARQERKSLKAEAKETAKKIKADAKKAIEGGGTFGAKAGSVFASVKTFVVKNWQIILVVVLSIVAIYFLFFAKKKSTGARRRRPAGIFRASRRGTSSMKARMAKVRAARKRRK